MREPTPASIISSISRLTSRLVEVGLADHTQPPKQEKSGRITRITTASPVDASVLKSVRYSEIYDLMLERRAYNARLLDQALIQLAYEFHGRVLVRQRLAFLPSPHLVDFDNDPEIYWGEVPYVDIVGTQAVKVPMRVDYDVRPSVDVGVDHPAAHLTLGQYKHCRIPVSAPVTPAVFVDFIVRHFYRSPNTSDVSFDLDLSRAFRHCDPEVDRESVHLISPGRR